MKCGTESFLLITCCSCSLAAFKSSTRFLGKKYGHINLNTSMENSWNRTPPMVLASRLIFQEGHLNPNPFPTASPRCFAFSPNTAQSSACFLLDTLPPSLLRSWLISKTAGFSIASCLHRILRRQAVMFREGRVQFCFRDPFRESTPIAETVRDMWITKLCFVYSWPDLPCLALNYFPQWDPFPSSCTKKLTEIKAGSLLLKSKVPLAPSLIPVPSKYSYWSYLFSEYSLSFSSCSWR